MANESVSVTQNTNSVEITQADNAVTISSTTPEAAEAPTNENIQDVVGGMVTGNTETGIAVTYEDGDGTLDFVVASQTDENFTTADHSKLDGIEASATADQTAAEIRALVESASDSNVFTDADHSKLNAIEASADVTDTTNVVAALTAGSNITIAGDGTISATPLTNEQVQDVLGAMVTSNTESGITVTYEDGDGTLDFAVASQTDENFTTADHSKLDGIEASADVTDTTNVVAALTAGSNISIAGDGTITGTDTNTQLSTEQVQDIVGGMLTGNTESGITVAYEDGDGTIDFTVATQSDVNFTSADHSKLDGIEAGATADQDLSSYATQSYVGTQITNLIDSSPAALNTLNELAAALGDDASFSTTVTNSIATKLALAGGTMTGNIVMSGSETVDGRDISADGTALDTAVSKLSYIEAGATADQTAEEIQDIVGAMVTSNTESGITVSYEDGDGTLDFAVASQTDENFTTADHSKLDGIEASATADQTAAEIRALVESATDSNVFTDADHTKLNAIEASADVTDTTNVVAALTAGSNIAIAGDGTITGTDTNTQLSTEQVQDIVGGMLTGNTESGITVAYEDGDGTIDFTVSTQSDVNFTSADHSKLDGIEASADVTDTTNVVAALTAGSNIAIAGDGTITGTDTNTQLSDEYVQDLVGAMTTGNTENGITVAYQDADGTLDFTVASQTDENFTTADHSKLDGIEASATADQTAAEIRALVESASDSNVFTDADHSKLNAIEASADVTDTTNVVAALTAGSNITIAGDGTVSATPLTNEQVQDVLGAMVTSNTESGITVTYEDGDGTLDFAVASQTDENFTTADHTKLDGIEALATADQTAAEIRALVESASDSNVFTDADHTKLNAIEASADVTDTANVVAALTAGSNIAIAGDGTITGTDTNTQLSTEQVQDIIGGMLTGNTESGITVAYEDGDGTIDFTVASQTDENFTSADHTALDAAVSKLSYIEAGATADQTAAEIRALVESASDSNVFTDADHTKLNAVEASADVTDTANVVAALTAGSNIAIAGDGTITGTDTNTQLSTEQVQDIVGGMLTGNTESGITVAYEDGDGTIDFTVSTQSDVNFTSADHSKLDGIEASATADQTDEEIEDIVGGMLTGNTETGITVTYQDADGTIDFVVDSQTDENFTSADHTALDAAVSKLSGIETSATADQTAAEIRTLVDSASDSNVFTDADQTNLDANTSKLSYIEAGATADQTAAEIRTLVDSASDSNVFTDADHTKLDGLDTVSPLTSDTSTAYTLVLGDQGNHVSLSNASAITVTVPTNSSVSYTTGTEICLFQAGAGQVTIQGDSGVTLNAADSELKTRVQYSSAILYKVSTDTWLVAGDLTA